MLKKSAHASRLARLFICMAALCLCGPLFVAASRNAEARQWRVDYARDVFPILHGNCVGCHNTDTRLGGFALDTYEALMKGGSKGAAIVPGSSDASRLVLMLEGKVQPKMPLKGELKPSEIATIKAWIAEGAGNAEAGDPAPAPTGLTIPDIKPRVLSLPQVSSLAYRPDGRMLAVAGYKHVQVLDAQTGSVSGKLAGPADAVRALAYSPDGRLLAAGGGPPARSGEVVLWDIAGGAVVRAMKGHTDYIYSVAFSPNGRTLATSSYDRVIKLWDVATGRELITLKDHTDAVYQIAFSPDGTRLASSAADRTVKLWDVASGARLFTLSDALDALYTVAFHPSGKSVSAAGADKRIYTWSLTGDGGSLTRSVIAHEDEIVQIACSPDGRVLGSTGADRMIKLWDVGTGAEIRVLDRQPDWALSLAFSPDGTRLAVGRYDGSVSIYDVNGGQRVLDPIRP